MRSKTLPPWLIDREYFFGRDGEEDGGDGDKDGDGGDGDEGGDDELPKKDQYTEEDVTGLKSALAKERKERRDAAKELKELRKLRKEKEEADLAKKGDAEREKARADKAEEKLSKLAPAIKRREVNDAILAEARRLKFIDETDALSVFDEVEAEQDEDDPSNVTVDLQSVKKAVKKLADTKKHLIAKSTESGGPTGSSFNRRTDGGGEDNKDKDAELRRKYRI